MVFPSNKELDVVTAESGCRYRLIRVGLMAGLASVALLVTTGCCGHAAGPCVASQCGTQVQFFSPPGATVTVRYCPGCESHEVGEYAPFENRLELSPEEYSVFNLAPGRYEFKYVSAEGLPGVSVYGELDVKHVNTSYARVFQRRAFVPISLPSAYYTHITPQGDETFPWRGEAVRTAIDDLDLQRLQQGDVIEKVFVVANLEDADEDLRDAEVKLAVAEREQQYAEARFKNSLYDFQMDVSDPLANFCGTDKDFIKREANRQRSQQKVDAVRARIARLQALLKGDHVVIRKGMLVVATQQIVKPYHDPEESSGRIGEVLLVMRVGGRHMHWGKSQGELATYQQ
jgi:hypothetical protein